MEFGKPTLKQITNREEYVKIFLHLRELEGWSGCEVDGDLYLAQAKGRGFWTGLLDNNFFCTFSFLEYPENKIAFFGSFITKKEFRGKGHTFPLFKKKYDELKEKGFQIIFVTEDKNLELYYKKLAIRPTGKIDFLCVKSGDFIFRSLPQSSLVKASEVSFQDFFAYDKEICGYDRSIGLRLFQSHPELKCDVFVENGKMKGYSVLKKSTNGFRIFPLLADRKEIAQALIERAIEEIPKDSKVYIFCPHPLRSAELKEMGFEQFFVSNIMGEHPNDLERTYGVFSTDAGL